ncbi:MAG TPA: polyprenyl synthetase family protein, partial [Anaerolineales bacterium]|nr:polyprenyl synthetase family protein [Anaerolineales bacterium]
MTFQDMLLPAIEDEMRAVLTRLNGPRYAEMQAMLTYHLGWEGEGAGPKARGKRVRPLLLLLTMAAAGGRWE